MTELNELNIEIFADGANIDEMVEMASKPLIKGLTTNPTLMRKAGILDYREFASRALSYIKDKPISFEIFSENLDEMILQGREVGSWADNVYVKVPITNSAGVETFEVIKTLSSEGVKVNVTAIMTIDQVVGSLKAVSQNTPAFFSIFAGRIADTGRDPMPLVQEMLEIAKDRKNIKFIWASPRELLNIFQANSLGCHVITATKDILDKLHFVGKDLDEYSLETVKMFQEDARKSGYIIGSA
jgi:transaldolase